MIKNYLKLFAAAAMLSLSVTACDKENTEPNDENKNQEEVDFMTKTPFTLSAEQVTPINFLLDVKVGDYDGNYFMFIDFKESLEEDFGGDIEAAAAEKLRLTVGDQLQVTDFSKTNNYTIFAGDNKIEATNMWRVFLSPGNEVVAYVFGVNEIGEMTTKVAALDVSLLPPTVISDAALKVTADKVNPTSVDVSIAPEDGVDQYCVFALLAKDCAEGGYYTGKAEANGTDPYIEAAMDYFTNARYFHTIDFLKVDNEDLFSGDQSTTVTQWTGNNAITPNNDYTIIAIGVDSYGYVASHAGHVNVTTPAQIAADLTFEVVFNEYAYADDGFAFKVYPSDKNAYYYINVATKAEVDALGGASNVEGILGLFSEYGIQDNLTYGDSYDFRRYSELSVNTDYYVVLFGYNGGITSDITLVPCKTGAVQ